MTEKNHHAAMELVPDGPERVQPGFLGAAGGRRVGESPVDPSL